MQPNYSPFHNIIFRIFKTIAISRYKHNDPENIIDWIRVLEKLGYALKKGHIDPLEWQDKIDVLFNSVNMNALLKKIDFENIKHHPEIEISRNKERFIEVPLLSNCRLSNRKYLITKIAKVAKGRSIIPHGHANMVSVFLIISGEFHIRQYDSLHVDEEYVHIRPVSDFYSKAGQWISQSELRNNIHWLTAMTNDSYIFSSKIINIQPGVTGSGRIYVDPAGQVLGNGVIKAKRLNYDQAYDRYG